MRLCVNYTTIIEADIILRIYSNGLVSIILSKKRFIHVTARIIPIDKIFCHDSTKFAI